MKVWVNKEECIGCGVCVAIAPNYFVLEDDGKSVAINGDAKGKVDVNPGDEELVKTAAQSCPTGAIKIEE